MKRLHADPQFAADNAQRASERMRKLHTNPEFAADRDARMRKLNADPAIYGKRYPHLAPLTNKERAEYDACRRFGYSKDEALAAVRAAAAE